MKPIKHPDPNSHGVFLRLNLTQDPQAVFLIPASSFRVEGAFPRGTLAGGSVFI